MTSPWLKFVRDRAKNWARIYRLWADFLPEHKRIWVRYEKLLEDPARELRRILPFLGVAVNETLLTCAVERRQGLFNRKPQTEEEEGRKLTVEDVLSESDREALFKLKANTFEELKIE